MSSSIASWAGSRSGRLTGAIGWALAVVTLTGALVGSSWYATYERLEGRAAAVILDDVVEVLAGPGANNATLFTVHEGLTVEVRAGLAGDKNRARAEAGYPAAA